MGYVLMYNWCMACHHVFGCLDILRKNDDRNLECKICCDCSCVWRDIHISKERRDNFTNFSDQICKSCLLKSIKKVDKKKE